MKVKDIPNSDTINELIAWQMIVCLTDRIQDSPKLIEIRLLIAERLEDLLEMDI